jgi:GcrA cell cycle regulator
MGGNAWTDDAVALLRKLWAEGATAAAIGLRLGGLSRSAVLGKVFRLRFDCGAGAKPVPAAPRGQTVNEIAVPLRRRNRQPRKRIAAPPPKLAGRLTLLELTNESCRWPSGRSGKFFFCGVAEADVQSGIPYCPRHMRRAYTESVSFERSKRGDIIHAVNSAKVGVPV